MASKTFIPGTVVDSPWLNDVNSNVYKAVGTAAGVSARTVQQKFAETISVKDFGAVGDGTTDDTVAINNALFSLTAGGTLWFPPGTYRITGQLFPRANTAMRGTLGATIKQGALANLNVMINFDGLSAANSCMYDLTIDGNRANNTQDNTRFLVYTSQNNTKIVNCVFRDAPGFGINIHAGAHHYIENNLFDSIRESGIILAAATANTSTSSKVLNNTFVSVGLHAIHNIWCDNNTLSGNKIEGTVINHSVSTVGTSVSLQSGTDFLSLKGGMIMRINFVEYQIASVNSFSNITLTTSAGVQNNISTTSGSGDLINVDASSGTTINDNLMSGGMSGGIVVHTEAGTASVVLTTIVGNSGTGIGGTAISLQGYSVNTGTIDTAVVVGNVVGDCGRGGVANPTFGNAGISVVGTKVSNIILSGNTSRNFGGTQSYGIYVEPTATAGSVLIGDNFLTGNTVADLSGGGWSTYTPTVVPTSGTITAASATGRYRKLGNIVHFQVSITITTAGTGSGILNTTIPFVAANSIFTAYGRENAVAGKMLQGVIAANGLNLAISNYDNTTPIANGAVLIITGMYESA